MKIVFLIIALAVLTALVDYLWLGVIAKSFYTGQLGELMRPAGARFDPRIVAAVAVYLLIAAAVVYFALPQSPTGLALTVARGAFLGFIIYGIYEFTNYAVITNWSVHVVVVDILWGTFLFSLITLVGFYLKQFLG